MPHDISEPNCPATPQVAPMTRYPLAPMTRYPLAPRQLSDGLVGHVLPRASPSRHYSDIAMPFRAAVSPYIHDEYRAAGDASDALLHLTGDRPTGGKTPPMLSRMKSEDMNPSPDKLKEIHRRKRADANKLRRREQCRANQARYRDKQRNAQVRLETSAQALHQELDSLKRKYRDLSSRERSNQSPWSIVAEVFRLLESSFRSPWRMATAQEMKNHTETRQILAVLERAFAHDTAMGELRGIDALTKQLRVFSQYFGSPSLRLERIEAVAPGVMAARANLTVTVTELTLRHVFPHVAESTGEEHNDGGYQQLLGQRLECSSSMNFLFDEDSDRVVRLETSIDIVAPLLRVLGSMKNVAEVLEHARMTSECVIAQDELVSR